MIDLHTHSFLSDGVLSPAELISRAADIGCRGLAISDHADDATMDFIVRSLRRLADAAGDVLPLKFLVGIEITHVPPARIAPLARRAKELGADVVLVHGQTLVEPVPEGTNRAAIEAGVDILAHPGLITPDEARMAATQGVLLEITSRKGHCLTNGHVAKTGRDAGARFVISSDAHEPRDLLSRVFAETVALGAGLSPDEVGAAFSNAEVILERERGS